MSTFLMPIYESDVGPYIIDVKANNGHEALQKFVEELKEIYDLPKSITTISELDKYITEEYDKGVLIIGEIYNTEDYKK
ncbi:hypothetical protein [Lachnospira sp.]|jgi:hypothetical protein|uniref:hypothetical protein n=1 Tax=Lachnospira sp. TaxID=2049031 RepID=UPI0025801E5C|nr:hypothetical protein [Lachnospira sp.]